jgi:N-acetylglucosamine kinase-like BadF-type ATPase
VVVASGTGSITYAVGETLSARVDGWGSQLGDAGSGFSIGQAALVAVMRAYDGRGPQTALTGVVKQDFDDLEQAYIEIQQDQGWVRRIAAYSKLVAALADSDDEARRILETAGYELAVSAAAGLRRVGEDQQSATLVSVLGKVFRSKAVKATFDKTISELVPNAQVVPPRGEGLDGAAMLFQVPESSPLFSDIRFAG